MLQKLMLKFRSKKGESIAETLVALLISSLALIMFAGCITSSGQILKKSRDKMSSYYNQNEVVANREEGLPGNMVVSDEDGNSFSYSVSFYKNDVFSHRLVTTYKLSEGE